MMRNVVAEYLDLLDFQRKGVLTALDSLSEDQIWQQPGLKEWCIGEILSHTMRFWDSFMPGLRFMCKVFGWYGQLRRDRPYRVEIENVYQRPNFPMWSGFLWTPRHNPQKPVAWTTLKREVETTYGQIQAFYTGNDPGVLGHIHAYDPAIGVVNLITGLKVGIDHDQLHYDDMFKMAASLQVGG